MINKRLLVLAGGFGTRLQSVVSDVPKALAPVGDIPFLHLQIENWLSQGLRSFVFLLHHQAELIIEFLEFERNKLLKDCELKWVIEPTALDTGGAVAYAVSQLNLTSDFLLTNADTWLGTGMSAVAQSKAPSMAVLSVSDASRYGQVEFDDQLKVTSFLEKSNTKGSGWINAGICHLNVNSFQHWDGRPFSLERILLTQLANDGGLLTVVLQTDFIDIGIPEDYGRFFSWIKSGKTNEL
jgi:D-glycero-alpha-D-manno-heptose 1-phosphate guanylyltransferase